MMTSARLAHRALAIVALALTAIATPGAAQWREIVPVFRVGLLAGPNPNLVAEKAEPFRAYLAERLGTNVEILPAADLGTLISGQINGRLHAAFLSATAFATASVTCGACVEPLVIPTAPGGEAGYFAILVTRAGGPVRGPADLPGRRLAVSAADSIAGRLLPLRLFADDGIAVERVTLVERDSPAAALAALMAGEADAALAWSSLGGDAATGYADGALTELVAAGVLRMVDVAIVWVSPLIPSGPLAVRADLPEGLKAELRAIMIDLPRVNAAAYEAIRTGIGGGFAPADAGMFLPLLTLVTPRGN